MDALRRIRHRLILGGGSPIRGEAVARLSLSCLVRKNRLLPYSDLEDEVPLEEGVFKRTGDEGVVAATSRLPVMGSSCCRRAQSLLDLTVVGYCRGGVDIALRLDLRQEMNRGAAVCFSYLGRCGCCQKRPASV
ncbi:hypothetical protein ACLOJK_019181 [Asimina triloba]